MKLHRVFTVLVLLCLLVFITSSIAAVPASMAAQPSADRIWHEAPFPPNEFQYARHDSAFVPGPELEPWVNKVYFPGGRTTPTTESPNIWVFDPVTGVYTDTGADMVEDVSNYNANLILDDGTGRGPSIYVIGGTNKDGGGASIGLVQRYYPQTNQIEGLPTDDNWNGMVNGSRVAAMGTAVVDDIIYVFGGWETNSAPYFSSETWVFDPTAPSGSRWTNLNLPLHTARSYIMSAVQDGKVYSIGGVGSFVNDELDPVDTFEVLDPANLAIGWTELAPMPIAGGEGRAYGFDSDTRKASSPWQGKIYVVAANDWSAVSGEVMIYDIPTNTWRYDLPELPTPRADLAGSFVPLCSPDPNDGLPGLWTFGGRKDPSCNPPLGPTEYYPLPCEDGCIGIDRVDITGTLQLMINVTATYTATTQPADASNPSSLLWSNGETTPVTKYSWSEAGDYTVVVTGTNCDGSIVVPGTLEVEVYAPCVPFSGVEITGPVSLEVGETGIYSLSVIPITATMPISIEWSNGVTEPVAAYTWDEAGVYEVSVLADNCDGTPYPASLEVGVFKPVPPPQPVWLPLITKAEMR